MVSFDSQPNKPTPQTNHLEQTHNQPDKTQKSDAKLAGDSGALSPTPFLDATQFANPKGNVADALKIQDRALSTMAPPIIRDNNPLINRSSGDVGQAKVRLANHEQSSASNGIDASDPRVIARNQTFDRNPGQPAENLRKPPGQQADATNGFNSPDSRSLTRNQDTDRRPVGQPESLNRPPAAQQTEAAKGKLDDHSTRVENKPEQRVERQPPRVEPQAQPQEKRIEPAKSAVEPNADARRTQAEARNEAPHTTTQQQQQQQQRLLAEQTRSLPPEQGDAVRKAADGQPVLKPQEQVGKVVSSKDLARPADGTGPSLDPRDPQARQFLQDVAKRIESVKLDGPNLQNTRLTDVLKGLDPQRVTALEKFLSKEPNIEPGKLTLSQLDPLRLQQLQTMLKGPFETGQGPLSDFNPFSRRDFTQLVQQLKFDALSNNPFSTGDPMRSFDQSGRFTPLQGILNQFGRAMAEVNGQTGQSLRMADVLGRSPDLRAALGQGNATFQVSDFQVRLNPFQERLIQSMLGNNAQLLNLLDGGRLGTILRPDSARGQFNIQDAGKVSGPDLTGIQSGLAGNLSGLFVNAFGAGMAGREFAVRGDAATSIGDSFRGHHDGHHNTIHDGTRPTAYDGIPRGMSVQDYISRLPIDSRTGMPFDPDTGKILDPATGRPIGDYEDQDNKRRVDKKLDEEDKKKREEDLEAEEKARKKALLMLLQAKKKRQQELQEKEKERKRKEEDGKRIRYVCKEGDTLPLVASRQLRDEKLASLIYQINKQVIPVENIDGNKTPCLRAGLVIWLPSPREIRDFKGRQWSSATSAQNGPVSTKKFATPEEELAAMFGARWSGDSSGQNPPDTERLSEAEIAESKRRLENVEKVLGPITSSARRKPTGERISYVVRLGEQLKSIAIKHPSLRDITLWRLIAEINGLSTELDDKGIPKAKLVRGSTILLPNQAEILEFRRRIGFLPSPGVKTESMRSVSKMCPKCGRMTVGSASLCPGCGYEFPDEEIEAVDESEGAEPDAGMIILEAAGLVKQPVKTEDLEMVREQGSEEPAYASAQQPPGAPNSRFIKDTVNLDMLQADQADPLRTVREPDATIPVREQDLEAGSAHTVNLNLPSSPTLPVSEDDVLELTASRLPQIPLVWASEKILEHFARLVKSANNWEEADGRIIIGLQITEETNDWKPIVEYEIHASHSFRHTYIPGGGRKSVKIDLPALAAVELAQNDLQSNWRNYVSKHLSA